MLTTVNLPLLEKIKNAGEETRADGWGGDWCDDYNIIPDTTASPW